MPCERYLRIDIDLRGARLLVLWVQLWRQSRSRCHSCHVERLCQAGDCLVPLWLARPRRLHKLWRRVLKWVLMSLLLVMVLHVLQVGHLLLQEELVLMLVVLVVLVMLLLL